MIVEQLVHVLGMYPGKILAVYIHTYSAGTRVFKCIINSIPGTYSACTRVSTGECTTNTFRFGTRVSNNTSVGYRMESFDISEYRTIYRSVESSIYRDVKRFDISIYWNIKRFDMS